jgi:hypothetical protein
VWGFLLVGGRNLSLVRILPIHFRMLIVNDLHPARRLARGVFYFMVAKALPLG